MTQFASWEVHADRRDGAADLARKRLGRWLDELAHDLKLAPARPLVCTLFDPPGDSIELQVDGQERLTLRLPRRLERDDPPDAEEAARDLAERAHRAVFAARWWLMRAFADVRSDRLRLAAELGLNLDDLQSFGNASGPDAGALEATAARRADATCRLLLPPEWWGTPDASTHLQMTLDAALRQVGVPCRAGSPRRVSGARLAADRFRLRVRRLRTPTYPLPRTDDDSSAQQIVAQLRAQVVLALQHHAGMLIDGDAVGRLLLNPGALPLADARALLRQASLAQWAGALRRLFDDRVSLPTAGQLAWAATVLPMSVSAWPGVAVAMPGAVAQSSQAAPDDTNVERLALQLRAPLMPHTLQRRSADAGYSALSVWELRPGDSGRSAADSYQRLVDAALPCARAEGVLLTPPGHALAVRRLLADALPTLLVVDTREWPEDVPLRRRTVITSSVLATA